MSLQFALAIFFAVAALVDLALFIRLGWKNRHDETWAQRAATLGLVMIGVFLYCAAMFVWCLVWGIIG